MTTKEEILSAISGEVGIYLTHGMVRGSEALEAMEEYAKKTAISFKEWQDSNLEEKKWENYDGHDTWINPHTREVISTEQLYELFLKSK